MKKKAVLLIVGVLGVVTIGTKLFKKDLSLGIPVENTEYEHRRHSAGVSVTAAGTSSIAPDKEALKPVSPWDYYLPLTSKEKREFEPVEVQVHKFLTWGKMDPEAVPSFRQMLFKIGDRAIADLARGLSQITRDDIKGKSDAEGVIHKIDMLGYFANSQNPLAADSVAYMAKRPVVWNESGELLNSVEANITFEMFDIFARYRPGEAAEFIRGIDKQHRAAYFTHYAYGRKLAGKTMEEIDQELRLVFGSPELALK